MDDKSKIQLAWGNCYFLLDILSAMCPSVPTLIRDLEYAPDKGLPELLEHTRRITEQCTGNTYKHYMITNGGTQAINTILRVKHKRKQSDVPAVCFTNELTYPFYGQMIKKATYEHRKLNPVHNIPWGVKLIDSPSNPWGLQSTATIKGDYTIWDGVYHNKIFNACPIIKPAHDVFVGSYSKLLGVTGARVGWLATNSDEDFEAFLSDSLHENATVSMSGQQLVVKILDTINLDRFMAFGKNALDFNREIFNEIRYLLDRDVPSVGMFYAAHVDEKIFQLLDKANVSYIRLKDREGDVLRLNMGQTCDIIRKAINSIKTADRRTNG